jgi:hypothetical protein
MIKKTTIATFRNGEYKGEYDWTGGIPLSNDELITVAVNGNEYVYRLTQKETRLDDNGEDQDVQTKYYFELEQ